MLIEYIITCFVAFILSILVDTMAIHVGYLDILLPDFYLILTVIIGYRYGKEAGLLGGFTIGVIEDLLSFFVFGMNIFLKSLIGFLVGFIRERFLFDRSIVFIGSTCVVTIIERVSQEIFTGSLDSLLDDRKFYLSILGVMISNGVCSFFLNRAIQKFFKKKVTV